jgi:hypothetical protein
LTVLARRGVPHLAGKVNAGGVKNTSASKKLTIGWAGGFHPSTQPIGNSGLEDRILFEKD